MSSSFCSATPGIKRRTHLQFPIKAEWWDASLAPRDFSQNNKLCIHLSTAKTIIYLASFLQCLQFYQSRFPILISNKSAAEVWIGLVSFSWLSLPHVFFCSSLNWKGWKMASESLHCHLYFPQNNHFFSLKYKSDIAFLVFLLRAY